MIYLARVGPTLAFSAFLIDISSSGDIWWMDKWMMPLLYISLFNDLFILLCSILLRMERTPLTSHPQYSLFFSFVRAVWKPMLRGVKYFSTVDFHVERGLPFGHFHDRGTRAWSAHYVSRMSSIPATWPNKIRWRLETILLNGCWEVLRRISTLVIWSNQQTLQIRLKHHWSNASILSLSDWVTVQVSEAYRALGLTQMS